MSLIGVVGPSLKLNTAESLDATREATPESVTVGLKVTSSSFPGESANDGIV